MVNDIEVATFIISDDIGVEQIDKNSNENIAESGIAAISLQPTMKKKKPSTNLHKKMPKASMVSYEGNFVGFRDGDKIYRVVTCQTPQKKNSAQHLKTHIDNAENIQNTESSSSSTIKKIKIKRQQNEDEFVAPHKIQKTNLLFSKYFQILTRTSNGIIAKCFSCKKPLCGFGKSTSNFITQLRTVG